MRAVGYVSCRAPHPLRRFGEAKYHIDYLEPYTDAYSCTHTHALTTNVNTGVNQRHYASSAHALGLKIVLRYDVLADFVSNTVSQSVGG